MAAKYAYHRYVSTSDEKEAALKFGPTPHKRRDWYIRVRRGRGRGKYGRANMRASVCTLLQIPRNFRTNGEKQANSAPGIIVK